MLRLEGLKADSPQGWMAAVGVMRILANSNVKALMSWDHLTPVILGIDRTQLVNTIDNHRQQGGEIVNEIKCLPLNDKGKIHLDFSSGKVNFFNVIEKMSIDTNKKLIERDLFQPWKNTDDFVSLGWDPSATKQAATLPGNKAPDSAEHKTNLAGQWLAAESLPITCPTPTKLREYTWVTWGVPLDIEGLYSVIKAQTTEWEGAKYKSLISKNGQLGFFLPSISC